MDTGAWSKSHPTGAQQLSSRTLLRRIFTLVAAVALLTLGLLPGAAAADTPAISVTSPAQGATITTTDIDVQVAVTGMDIACPWVGTADQDGQGNIHVFLDKASLPTLINFYCGTDSFTVSGAGITPGQHSLLIDLASNTHGDIASTMQEVKFDYEPTTPSSLPAPKATDATASINIVSPADGATVDSQFTLQLASENFTASCDLEGKAEVAGFGHYHLVIDAETAPSPLAGLVAMPCDPEVPLDLSGWSAGTHTISLMVAQNDHTPVPNALPAMITVTVNNAAGATGQVLPNTGDPSDSDGTSWLIPAILMMAGAGLVAIGGVTLRRHRTERA
jgi:hypothetical protein